MTYKEWLEKNADKFEHVEIPEKFWVHFTPYENYEGIAREGLYSPNKLIEEFIQVKETPYMAWDSSRGKEWGREGMEDIVLFGSINNRESLLGNTTNGTFNKWFRDATFLSNHIGFHYTGDAEPNGWWRVDRFKVKYHVPFEELEPVFLIDKSKTSLEADTELIKKLKYIIIFDDDESRCDLFKLIEPEETIPQE